MDRIINVKVGGNYLIKDNKNAGVRGEANVTRLRITFDDGWITDEYAKRVVFWDARGLNPVVVDLLPTLAEDDRTYLVPIPQEPMMETGKLTFVIEGTKDNKVQRSLSDKLEVKDSPIAENAGQPVDPTPDELAQIRGSLEEVKGDIIDAMQAKADAELARDEAHMFNLEAGSFSESANLSALDALMYKNEAENAADRAESTIGKSSYIGANGNWWCWDDESGEFYDTGVKAQSGSTVYVGDNPPEDADVWINPDGEGDDYYTKKEVDEIIEEFAIPSSAYINILGGADNWEAEDVKNSSGNVIGVRYGQRVNVNNAVITENSKVDLQITSEQMVIFYQKDLAFVTENDDGVVTVYCVGNIPENDYKIQAIVTEVVSNG